MHFVGQILRCMVRNPRVVAHPIIITLHPDFFEELIHIVLNHQRAANYSVCDSVRFF